MPSVLVVPSPVGPLGLSSHDGCSLSGVRFAAAAAPDRRAPDRPAPDGSDPVPVLRQAAEQLQEYFAGQRREFTVPLTPRGTPFQLAVWQALLQVPFGQTVSYGELARRLGLPPGASRAVGAANGANPLPIVVPCHRVVGADGRLTGFGGGLPRKAALLRLEGVATEADQLQLF